MQSLPYWLLSYNSRTNLDETDIFDRGEVKRISWKQNLHVTLAQNLFVTMFSLNVVSSHTLSLIIRDYFRVSTVQTAIWLSFTAGGIFEKLEQNILLITNL
jgi:hypothetical protein